MQPVSPTRLQQIATDACDSALSNSTSYSHTSTESWNSTIINSILQSLISETSTPSNPPSFKYAVNSTIIQHLSDPQQPTTNPDTETSHPSSKPRVGRRGMHSATGAYWDNERDGMWSFKYEGGEAKGMDVVISLIWVAIPGHAGIQHGGEAAKESETS
ncbi:Tctex-1 [Cryomyces antarcticus]|uniref:Topoisomerase I damage affected protein 2 n=1 Tax=Cryomyces antarcticus TaxID=329879 RepID=A0ABR0M6S5_9PEZI|nr:hypothetical protein LTR60_007768 [Cryomyces antarcticus]KAK5002287.1 hypothetical protein LTR39_006727 [Cryomyces antarcticus]KAK5169316.1 hypothetical protein LTR04_005651 [Oleoguttula sp. CCFEE 6159]KAK5286799.1 hypothetical protein LTR16_004046 [Cryomyces antarcticus]